MARCVSEGLRNFPYRVDTFNVVANLIQAQGCIWQEMCSSISSGESTSLASSSSASDSHLFDIEYWESKTSRSRNTCFSCNIVRAVSSAGQMVQHCFTEFASNQINKPRFVADADSMNVLR